MLIKEPDFESWKKFIPATDVILVVPPFGSSRMPSLGVHILQQICHQQQLSCGVVYMNMMLASLIGEANYFTYNQLPKSLMLGERILSRKAFGIDGFDDNFTDLWLSIGIRNMELSEDFSQELSEDEWRNYIIPETITQQDLFELRNKAELINDWLCGEIVRKKPKIVGATTMFEQTTGAISILNGVKKEAPNITTIIGGANCTGSMAEAVGQMSNQVDFIFSGESDEVFERFIANWKVGKTPQKRIIRGMNVTNMDTVPTPNYQEYIEQSEFFLSDLKKELRYVVAESSRGCWWGEKKHCIFCGLTAESLAYRQKSPDLMLEEIKKMDGYGASRIFMADLILPQSYHNTFIPQLKNQKPESNIVYEVKANMSLNDVKNLVDSGVGLVVPGIESFEDNALKIMRKGISAKQNIQFMRKARAVGLRLQWNILYGFPGERKEDLNFTIQALPYLFHFDPPGAVGPPEVQRFSPMHTQADEFGIKNIRPIQSYYEVFPPEVDKEKMAYYFDCEYESETLLSTEIKYKLNEITEAWKTRWKTKTNGLPELSIYQKESEFWLKDTRTIDKSPLKINQAQVELLLKGLKRNETNPYLDWALTHQLLIPYKENHIAIATSSFELMSQYINPNKR